MSKKAYDTLTTASIFLIAASAILADRLAQYSSLFGGIAITCALASTWIYFRHGMRKAREGDGDGGSPTAPGPEETLVLERTDPVDATFEVVDSTVCATHDNILVLEEAFEESNESMRLEVEEVVERLRPISFGAATLLNYKSLYHSARYVARPQRTFAEEVVGIVKGLTEPGNSMYEFEFKPDGSFRVVPCTQHMRRADETRRLDENVRAMESQERVVH